jgi:hypothetical protein
MRTRFARTTDLQTKPDEPIARAKGQLYPF